MSLEKSFPTVEQAMGNPPNWITYWGITIVALFFSIVLAITAFVYYPDSLNASAIIYLDQPPIEVIAPQTKYLEHLLVEDGQQVSKSQPLLILHSTVNWEIALQLDSLLNRKKVTKAPNFPIHQLGSLQNTYQEWLLAHQKYQATISHDLTSKKLKATQQEIIQTKALNSTLKEQRTILEKELKNLKHALQRTQQLHENKSISQVELETTENQYWQQERMLHQLDAQIINNKIRLQQLELSLPITTTQQQELYFNLQQAEQQKLQQLQMAVQEWKHQHVLLAPCAGKVVLPYTTLTGASVKAETVLLTLTPNNKQPKTFVQAKVPKQGIGKLLVGQQAIIHLDNYPSKEYGTLKAKVTAIALLPQEDNYTVTLDLVNDWSTNYRVSIPKQQNLTAQVVIATKEYSLLERILSGLIAALQH